MALKMMLGGERTSFFRLQAIDGDEVDDEFTLRISMNNNY